MRCWSVRFVERGYNAAVKPGNRTVWATLGVTSVGRLPLNLAFSFPFIR